MTTTSTAGRTCSQPASPGTKNNQLAIGMRVKVFARGMAQSDEVHQRRQLFVAERTSFTFRVEHAAKIDRVEIRWPSGKLDTLTDFPVGQFHSVMEGTGVVPPEGFCPNPAAKSNSQQAPQSLSQLARGPSVAANLPCNESCASPLFSQRVRYPPRGHLR